MPLRPQENVTRELFDEFPQVVGEQMWNFADFQTSSGIMRLDGNKKGAFTCDRRPRWSHTCCVRAGPRSRATASPRTDAPPADARPADVQRPTPERPQGEASA